jgi:hypothetical protein
MIAGVTNDLEWLVILTDLKNMADCLLEWDKQDFSFKKTYIWKIVSYTTSLKQFCLKK